MLLKCLKTYLVHYGWCKTSECTWYGEPSDALPVLYFSLSNKSTHKPLFYSTSNMKRSGAVFCYTHHPFQQYHRHYLQKEREKESNTSSNKKHSESTKPLHSLRSVKQSSQAWRSLAVFSFVISNRSCMFCEHPFTFHNVANKYGSRR